MRPLINVIPRDPECTGSTCAKTYQHHRPGLLPHRPQTTNQHPEYRVRPTDRAAIMSFDMFKAIPYERIWKLLKKPNAR